MQNNKPTASTQATHGGLSLKIHLIIGCILLLLAFIGVILTSWQNSYTHAYWLLMVYTYALSSLGLSCYSHHHKKSLKLATIASEILHWLGLIVAIYLVEHFKQMGLFSTPIASLVELLLLALTTYLAGIHFNSMFIIIGIFLALIALLSVIIFEYLSFIVLPILIGFMILLWLYMRHKHQPKAKNSAS